MPVAAPIAGAHIANTEPDYKQHYRQLHHDNRRIEARALPNANHQDRRNHQRNQKRGQIETNLHAKNPRRVHQIMRPLHQLRRLRSHNCRHPIQKRQSAGHERSIRCRRHLPRDRLFRHPKSRPVVVGQPERHANMENIQQLNKVIRPARRHGTGTHRIFQGQIPANNPGKNLAERGVGIGISAARQRNHGRKLRITKPRKGTAQARHHKRQHQRRPRIVRTQARQHENSRADNRAHAQRS